MVLSVWSMTMAYLRVGSSYRYRTGKCHTGIATTQQTKTHVHEVVNVAAPLFKQCDIHRSILYSVACYRYRYCNSMLYYCNTYSTTTAIIYIIKYCNKGVYFHTPLLDMLNITYSSTPYNVVHVYAISTLYSSTLEYTVYTCMAILE